MPFLDFLGHLFNHLLSAIAMFIAKMYEHFILVGTVIIILFLLYAAVTVGLNTAHTWSMMRRDPGPIIGEEV